MWLLPTLVVVGFVLGPSSLPSRAQVASWSVVGSMHFARSEHTATLLNNGKVLVVGGYGDAGLTAELFDPATATWTVTSGMIHFPPTGHTATLLNNGKVLVAGGDGAAGATAVLYDPATGDWTETGRMVVYHSQHTATLLSDGKVLVAGGVCGTCSPGNPGIAELYDPATGSWTSAGWMRWGRFDHTSTLLKNGNVLAAGTAWSGASAELYDPATGSWIDTASMLVGRSKHTAILLNDGKVLVAGGYGGGASVELYDPSAGIWSATGNMGDARVFHTATRLANGRVLVTGSAVGGDIGIWPQLDTAEEYDPASGSWGTRTFMRTGRSGHTATLLNDGRVLVAGGVQLISCDFFDFWVFCNPSWVTAEAEVYAP